MKIYSFKEPSVPFGNNGRSLEYVKATSYLPPVKCGENGCGHQWGNVFARIHNELPKDHPLRNSSNQPVSPDELSLMINEIKQTLNLPNEMEIQPGTRFGYVHVLRRSNIIPSFEWLKISIIVINDEVVDFLNKNKLTGWHVEPVIVDNEQKEKSNKLYELVIDGKGGMPITKPPISIISHCGVCGSTKYSKDKLVQFELDQDQWDQSDIFRFNPPFGGFVFVSEKMANALQNSPLSNYDLQSQIAFMEKWGNKLFL